MEQSPRLSLPYVQPAQAQKHVTVNETFRRLDALTQLTVLSQTIAVEPGSPTEGDAYILPASSTGSSWAGFTTGNVATFQDGAWMEITALEGFRAWVSDVDQFITFDGASWVQVSGGGSETALKFGVNATADTTNRLNVKTDAVLFSHDDVTPGNDDCIIKVNKKSVADTASHMFQTGFSGRAEFGLTGDDDFHIKVSPDGSSWTDAFFIDKDFGRVGVGTSSPTDLFHTVGGNMRVTRINADSPRYYAEASDISGLVYFGWDNGAIAQIGTVTNHSVRFMVNNQQRLRIHTTGGIEVGSPTGGDKGAGTINAVGVYDDNALLTCYVFDQALDGVINDKKWDDKVPDRNIPSVYTESKDPRAGKITRKKISDEGIETRTHQPMRKFRTRIGSEYDPLTLDGYAKHWQEKRHLTSLPNEVSFDPEAGMSAGEWIQRLVETVEIQAVLIEKLNQRTKAPGEDSSGEQRT